MIIIICTMHMYVCIWRIWVWQGRNTKHDCVELDGYSRAAAEAATDSLHYQNRIGTVDSLDRFNNNRSADGQTAGRLQTAPDGHVLFKRSPSGVRRACSAEPGRGGQTLGRGPTSLHWTGVLWTCSLWRAKMNETATASKLIADVLFPAIHFADFIKQHALTVLTVLVEAALHIALCSSVCPSVPCLFLFVSQKRTVPCTKTRNDGNVFRVTSNWWRKRTEIKRSKISIAQY